MTAKIFIIFLQLFYDIYELVSLLSNLNVFFVLFFWLTPPIVTYILLSKHLLICLYCWKGLSQLKYLWGVNMMARLLKPPEDIISPNMVPGNSIILLPSRKKKGLFSPTYSLRHARQDAGWSYLSSHHYIHSCSVAHIMQ